MGRGKGVKTGVYIPDDLVEELEKCASTLGIKSKSRIIQEALRLFIAEHRWRIMGSAVGIIGVIYNHDSPGVDEKLTDIQHNYLDIIISTLHVHLTKDKCMLAIIVRGDSARIKDIISEIEKIKGVLIVRPMVMGYPE